MDNIIKEIPLSMAVTVVVVVAVDDDGCDYAENDDD